MTYHPLSSSSLPSQAHTSSNSHLEREQNLKFVKKEKIGTIPGSAIAT